MNKRDEYYNKLYHFAKSHHNKGNVSNNEGLIKGYIEKILNNGDEYLLTDSVLDFIGWVGKPAMIYLYELSEDQYEKTIMLKEYYQYVFIDMSRNDDRRESFVLRLDDDLRGKYEDVVNRVNELEKHFQVYHFRFFDIRHIMHIVLAYYYLNKFEGNLNELCDIFLKDPYQTLEGLYLNEIRDRQGAYLINNYNTDCKIIDYVFSRIVENGKREIR